MYRITLKPKINGKRVIKLKNMSRIKNFLPLNLRNIAPLHAVSDYIHFQTVPSM